MYMYIIYMYNIGKSTVTLSDMKSIVGYLIKYKLLCLIQKIIFTSLITRKFSCDFLLFLP